jgi:hypothetical protein
LQGWQQAKRNKLNVLVKELSQVEPNQAKSSTAIFIKQSSPDQKKLPGLGQAKYAKTFYPESRPQQRPQQLKDFNHARLCERRLPRGINT